MAASALICNKSVEGCPAGGTEGPRPLLQTPRQNDVIHVCDGPSSIAGGKKKKCYPLLWQQRVISKERRHRFVCGMLGRFQEIERWEEEEWEMKLGAAPVQISGRWFFGDNRPTPPTPPPPPRPAVSKDSRLGFSAETLCSARREKARAEFSCWSGSHSSSASIWESREPFFPPRHHLPKCAATTSPSFGSVRGAKCRFAFSQLCVSVLA